MGITLHITTKFAGSLSAITENIYSLSVSFSWKLVLRLTMLVLIHVNEFEFLNKLR